MDIYAPGRLAVLIDGDNFPPDLAGALFDEVEKVGPAAINRIYGSSSAIAGWRAAAAKYGSAVYEVMPGKNATDMKLSIDAMDILHRGKITTFCIVSSDSDFAQLARRLREDAITVHGFGEAKAATSFQRACNCFKQLGMPKTPKQKGQVASAKHDPMLTVDAAWTKLLDKALRQLPKGTTQVAISELNQQVTKLDKSFSSKKYGGTSLKKLLKNSGMQVAKGKGGSFAIVP